MTVKKQNIPKFLKDDICKYATYIMKTRYLDRWHEMTPYMEKIMEMYNNVSSLSILQSYTDTDRRLRGVVPTTPLFVRKWYRQHGSHWYNSYTLEYIQRYFEKYLPEELRW